MAVMKKFIYLLPFAAFLANGVHADGGDDFSNNLISDLSPLLALFGERVTMQFMSQAMGWADDIILAMAPVGIITLLVSAIRVGGFQWLKAVIGRARENLAVAEQELMSSTSKEVCELWNSQEVVRSMGSASDSVAEFICLLPPATPDDTGSSTKSSDKSLSDNFKILVMDLEKAKKNYLNHVNKHEENSQSRNSATSNLKQSRDEESSIATSPNDLIIVQNKSADAPNISLNSPPRQRDVELRLVAAAGIMLQLGVLVYSGFSIFHPTLSFPKDERTIEKYTFVCFAIGTFVLSLGLLLCSHVVEDSTHEDRYQPAGKEVRLIWLQRTKTVSDQIFGSFALFAMGERQLILTSCRSHRLTEEDERWKLGVKTLVGTILGLCGYIVQFIGLRGMHWSVSVCQLGATLLMVGLKALVRRGLGSSLRSNKLDSGFELDWFAIALRDKGLELLRSEPKSEKDMAMKIETEHWLLKIPKPHEQPNQREPSKEAFKEPSKAQMVMQTRRDLKKLASWSGPAPAEAVAVARAIEITMRSLFDFLDGTFTWSLTTLDNEEIKFEVVKKDGKWNSSAEDIEAALSLWLFSAHRHKCKESHNQDKTHASASKTAKSHSPRIEASASDVTLRFLGPNTESLRRDLAWWMPSKAVRFVAATESSSGEAFDNYKVVGYGPVHYDASEGANGKIMFNINELDELDNNAELGSNGAEETKGGKDQQASFLATKSYKPLKLLFAQEMFSAFLWSITREKSVQEQPVENEADITPNDISKSENWQVFTLKNTKLSKMAQEIYDTGLGTPEEVYLSIIPPLSVNDRLPRTNAIISLTQQEALRHEKLQQWQQVAEVYLWLFRKAKTFPAESDFVAKATAVLFECHRQVVSAAELAEHENKDTPIYQHLKRLASHIAEELKSASRKFRSSLMGLYKLQGRDWQDDSAPPLGFHKLAWDDEDEEELAIQLKKLKFTDLHKFVAIDRDRDIRIEKFGIGVNLRDIHDWTTLHYAAKEGNTDIISSLLEFDGDPNAPDLLGWTPLHYACHYGNTPAARRLLLGGANVNVQGRDGIAPLHCAVMEGRGETVKMLVGSGASIDVLDASRKTPLLWAAHGGHAAVMEILIEKANTDAADKHGRTVSHLAALGGHDTAVDCLIIHSKLDANARDLSSRTPLHSAAMLGHEDVVSWLVAVQGVDKNAKDIGGQMPLHLAARTRMKDVVEMLIDEGADKEASDQHGHTPLHLAAEAGIEDVVEMLIEKGNNKKALDNYGRTPLHLASRVGVVKVVEMLVEKGADKEALDDYGQTPLHLAIRAGIKDVAEMLIEKGSNMEASDDYGQTPLHLSTRAGMKDVVEMLIQKGANKEASADYGRTPLYLAARAGIEGIVEMLIEKGADKEASDQYGQKPLHIATIYGEADVIAILLREGAKIDARDRDGRTPLHMSAEYNGSFDAATKLIEKGADKEAQDNQGQTPLHRAVQFGSRRIISLLLEANANNRAQDNNGKTPQDLTFEFENNKAVSSLR
ncbi:ankyrin repeat protein [Colletotrichum truncatum]|uniref:Ankyrin repeat protein n=1 Tax=Colletotrichum truncatum TaxID=5467 RepID=A0ACC3Z1W7_COLTU|nr:ankyrin repeat protein [Colletotrichum truncatum]KAF6781356.1 ankyrin repeat protein [Colletotrichum truncatum]